MTYPRQLTNPAQSAWPVIVNENGSSMAGAALYAPDGYGTSGLNLGYFGGHVEGTPVADGTVALTGTATNYVVAHRTTGVVSASTGTTNWDDPAYGRLCVAPTTSGAVDWSGFEDWRYQVGGINRAPLGGGSVTSVAATVPSFLSISGSPITTSGTLAIIYSGTALPVDNGGTGATTLTANNVLLGNGTSALQVVAPGTSGNVLTSNGTTWQSTTPASGVSPTQVDQWCVFMVAPANQDYRVVLDTKFGCTINEITTSSASGTCTLTGKINTTALGGTANSVSSSETTQTHSSANTVATGDDLVLTISSNSSCVDMSVTIKYTRTLA